MHDIASPKPQHLRSAWIALKQCPDLPTTPSSRHELKSNNELHILALRPSIASYKSQGILTICPSGAAFAIPLGPTNPWLIVIAKETLIFRRAGFSPALWLLVPTFLLRNAPAWVTPSPSPQIRMLSYRCILSEDRCKPSVSVLCLAPIIFGAKSLDE